MHSNECNFCNTEIKHIDNGGNKWIKSLELKIEKKYTSIVDDSMKIVLFIYHIFQIRNQNEKL